VQRSGMTSRERVLAVLAGKEYDRIPVINPTSIATVESMRLTHSCFPMAHTNSDAMAALASAGHDLLGFDSVSPYFSVHLEAAALGCDIDWGKIDSLPAVLKSPFTNGKDIEIATNFLDRKPIRALLTAIKALRKKYGNSVAIIGKVIGPWSLAYHLRGTANFLLDTVLEPQRVKQTLDYLMTVPIQFAHAQFEMGADMITWADHCTADLISAKAYEEFLLPVHKKCNATIKKEGPFILHVCGNVLDRLAYFCDAGFEAFHLDSRNDARRATELVNKRLILTGNINNPNVLLNGNATSVAKAVYAAIDGGIRLISPECALPCWVSNRNLVEIVKAARTKRQI
jgi:MtaA/CmuA family methyltransferase